MTNPSATRRLPGVEGVWVFVAADMVMFGVLFVSFMLERHHQPTLFEQSRHTLNPNFGGINTLILLTSSWFVVLAVEAAKLGRSGRIAPYLIGAMTCGAAFTVSKAIEYTVKITAGISMMTNDFYMYYFVLTGIHLLHVAAGCIVLLVLWRHARSGRYQKDRLAGLEIGATYWHMVDALWIVLFPLLYLVR